MIYVYPTVMGSKQLHMFIVFEIRLVEVVFYLEFCLLKKLLLTIDHLFKYHLLNIVSLFCEFLKHIVRFEEHFVDERVLWQIINLDVEEIFFCATVGPYHESLHHLEFVELLSDKVSCIIHGSDY